MTQQETTRPLSGPCQHELRTKNYELWTDLRPLSFPV